MAPQIIARAGLRHAPTMTWHLMPSLTTASHGRFLAIRRGSPIRVTHSTYPLFTRSRAGRWRNRCSRAGGYSPCLRVKVDQGRRYQDGLHRMPRAGSCCLGRVPAAGAGRDGRLLADDGSMIGDRWGVSDAEVLRAYPCDEFLASPVLHAWRGIRIEALAGAVWPWVAQIRRAPYSDPGRQLTGTIMGAFMSCVLVPQDDDTRACCSRSSRGPGAGPPRRCRSAT
jgi:hypothetical protein